jgi:hypothetical protein
MILFLHGRKAIDLELDGLDPKDYPDMADAYIAAANWDDTGEPLTDAELDQLLDQNQDAVHAAALESVFY